MAIGAPPRSVHSYPSQDGKLYRPRQKNTRSPPTPNLPINIYPRPRTTDLTSEPDFSGLNPTVGIPTLNNEPYFSGLEVSPPTTRRPINIYRRPRYIYNSPPSKSSAELPSPPSSLTYGKSLSPESMQFSNLGLDSHSETSERVFATPPMDQLFLASLGQYIFQEICFKPTKNYLVYLGNLILPYTKPP